MSPLNVPPENLLRHPKTAIGTCFVGRDGMRVKHIRIRAYDANEEGTPPDTLAYDWAFYTIETVEMDLNDTVRATRVQVLVPDLAIELDRLKVQTIPAAEFEKTWDTARRALFDPILT